MSARVLIVHDLICQAKPLYDALRSESIDVKAALSGAEAIELCRNGLCDLVVVDVSISGIDGFALCRALKSDPKTAAVPVLMITASDEPAQRLKGLDSGADEFVGKPVDEVAVMARIRSLARLKAITDELLSRDLTFRRLGGADLAVDAEAARPSILIVEDNAASNGHLRACLEPLYRVVTHEDPQEALFVAASGDFDLAIVSLDVSGYDGLRLCGQIRSLERTRQMGLLMLAQADENGRVLRGLDIGANDYLTRPIDRIELIARVKCQVDRKCRADRLRQGVDRVRESDIADPLTGLPNRRYLETHCAAMIAKARQLEQPLALLWLAIDRFQSLNEGYGVQAGDEVLKALAGRISRHVRAVDLIARLDGEEFVAVMPDLSAESARSVAERIRFAVENPRFAIDGGSRFISVTVSIGAAALEGQGDTVQTLMKRADEALYRAKGAGRNRVALRRVAA